MEKNPIDKDKTTETPSTLPYAHHMGSALVKPIDKGKVKGRAMAAMVEQTNSQLANIKTQMETLIEQAKSIHKRIEVSEIIYEAEVSFEPLVSHIYHLYKKENGSYLLSMIAPNEWGRKNKFEFVAEVKLLSDHTWQILTENIDL